MNNKKSKARISAIVSSKSEVLIQTENFLHINKNKTLENKYYKGM